MVEKSQIADRKLRLLAEEQRQRISTDAIIDGQRSKSKQLQGERERKEREQRVQANHDQIASLLLLKLHTEVRGDGVDLSGWTVTFDIERITGHPEGERTGQPLNTRDKSVRYISPEGRAFKTREAVAEHLGVAREEEPEAEETEGSSKDAKPSKDARPVKEPPPVEVAGELAFEVDRLLDVRRGENGKRQFLVRWVGYGSADDSWEPEVGFLDREPIVARAGACAACATLDAHESLARGRRDGRRACDSQGVQPARDRRARRRCAAECGAAHRGRVRAALAAVLRRAGGRLRPGALCTRPPACGHARS